MPTIPTEVVTKLGGLQNQIWQTVSLTVSEAVNAAVNFATPLTVAAKTADIYAELSVPMLVIQFSFASLPENSQVLLVPQETFTELAALIKGESVRDIDENLVAEVRPILEGIVQGLCLAIGNIKNEAIVASGLSIRFQLFSFPPNLQKADEIVRVQLAVTSDDVNGSLGWLMDTETAHMLLGMALTEEEEPEQTPFSQVDQTAGMGIGSAPASTVAPSDNSGLEILLDIPLEISVELGRVKMLVRDVIELGTGSIVEIEKAAGEPVDVMVNGRLVARGEVVVIEDNFGVRVTEILTPQERLNKLGEVA
jgi:flagellar motor switch protein FliN/FliY